MASDIVFNAALNLAGADTKLASFTHQVEDASGRMQVAGQRGGAFNGALGGIAHGAAALAGPVGLAVTIVGKLGSGLLAAGTAAGQEAAQVDQLTNSLKNNVPGWNGNTAALGKYIAKGEALAFTDTDIRQGLSLLVSQTHDLKEAQSLQSTAMDLARAKGIDLATATKLVMKADQGSEAALRKLGIVIDKNATQEQTLAAIHAATAGAADKFASSTEGSAARLQSAWGNAIEDIGYTILPLMQTAMGGVADFVTSDGFQGAFSKALEIVGTAFSTAGTVITNVVDTARPVIKGIADFVQGSEVQGAITGATTVMSAAFTLWRQVIGAEIGIATTVVKGIAEFIKGNAVQGAITTALGVINTAFAGVKTAVSGAKDAIQPALTIVASAVDALRDSASNGQPKIAALIEAIGGPDAVTQVQDLGHALQADFAAAVTTLAPMLQPTADGVSALVSSFTADAATNATNLGNAIKDDLATGLDSASKVIKDVGPTFVAIFSALSSPQTAAITGILTAAKPALEEFFNTLATPDVLTTVQDVGNALKDVFAGALTKIKEGIDIVGPPLGTFLNTTLAAGLDAAKKAWDDAQPAFDALGAWLASPEVQAGAATIGGSLNALATSLASLLTALTPAKDELTNTGTAISGLNDWLAAGQVMWDSLTTALRPVAETLGPNLTAMWENMQPGLQELAPLLQAVGGIIGGIVTFALANLIGVISGIVGALPGLGEMFTGTVQIIKGTVQLLWDWLQAIFTVGMDFLTGHWDQMGQHIVDALTNMSDDVQKIGEGFWNLLKGTFDAGVGFIKGFVEGMGTFIVGVFQGLYDDIIGHSIIPNLVTGVQNAISGMVDTVKTTISGWVESVKTFFTNLSDGAKTTVTGLADGVKSTFTGMVDSVKTTISGWVTSFTDTLGGLKDSVLSIAGSIGDAIQGALDFLKDLAKAITGLPSIPDLPGSQDGGGGGGGPIAPITAGGHGSRAGVGVLSGGGGAPINIHITMVQEQGVWRVDRQSERLAVNIAVRTMGAEA